MKKLLNTRFLSLLVFLSVLGNFSHADVMVTEGKILVIGEQGTPPEDGKNLHGQIRLEGYEVSFYSSGDIQSYSRSSDWLSVDSDEEGYVQEKEFNVYPSLTEAMEANYHVPRYGMHVEISTAYKLNGIVFKLGRNEYPAEIKISDDPSFFTRAWNRVGDIFSQSMWGYVQWTVKIPKADLDSL